MQKKLSSLLGFLSLIVAITIYLLLNNFPVRTGTGILKTEERSVSHFTRVHVSGISSVILQQRDTEHVTLEADSNLLAELESRVENGVLYLGAKDGITIDKATIRYTVTYRTLENIALYGSATATILDFQQPQLSVSLHGASMLAMSGHTDRLQLTQSGGVFSAFALTAQEVNADLSLEASAQITVQSILNVELHRNAQLVYMGDATVTQTVDVTSTLQKVSQ